MEGWIKLHRKITNWEWYTDVPVRVLYEHLLLTANYEDKKWRGIEIKRGQKLTSIRHLADETGLTVRQVRTALDKLVSTHNLTHRATHNYTLITVDNYGLYQSHDNFATHRATHSMTHERQQHKNNKNNKNIYIYKNFEKKDLENLYEN